MMATALRFERIENLFDPLEVMYIPNPRSDYVSILEHDFRSNALTRGRPGWVYEMAMDSLCTSTHV